MHHDGRVPFASCIVEANQIKESTLSFSRCILEKVGACAAACSALAVPRTGQDVAMICVGYLVYLNLLVSIVSLRVHGAL